MKPIRYLHQPSPARAGRPGRCSRRGVLTLGLVLCMIIILGLAGVVWNYQYMVYVNRDIANTAELTMDAMEGPYESYALQLAKAQMNYAVMDNTLAATGTPVRGPFVITDLNATDNITTPANFITAVTTPVEKMMEIVNENSTPNTSRIYKTGYIDAPTNNNPYTISLMINGGPSGATNDGQVIAKTSYTVTGTPPTVTWVAPTLTSGTISWTPNATEVFNQMATSRVGLYRYRNLGFFPGIFAHEKTEPLADGSHATLEKEVQSDQDVSSFYVALDPYVWSIASGTMTTHDEILIKTPALALPLSIFQNNNVSFLELFYPENTTAGTAVLTFSYTRTWVSTRRYTTQNYDNSWNYTTDSTDSDSTDCTVTYNSGTPISLGNQVIYKDISGTSIDSEIDGAGVGAINYNDYDTLNLTYNLYDGNLVCFPVVRTVTDGYSVVDFIVFRVQMEETLTPPGSSTPPDPPFMVDPFAGATIEATASITRTISLIPTCVVTNDITCDMDKRLDFMSRLITTDPAAADAFNDIRVNTSMSKLKVSETPIFP